MTEFKAKFFRNNLLDVDHPATGFTFSFTIMTDGKGRLDLEGPSVSGATWPDGDLQQRACDFARVAAEEHRQQTGPGTKPA